MRSVLGVCVLTGLLSPASEGQCRGPETQKLVAEDGSAGAYFGDEIAIDGDWALVAAPREDPGTGERLGAVYVMFHDGSAWTERQKLRSSDAADEDDFGSGVAIEGNRALIGALNADADGPESGAVYAFEFDGSAWNEVQKISVLDGATNDRLGSSIAIDGSVALIGAGGYPGPGAAYVFHHDGNQWQEVQKLVAADGVAGDTFGSDVDLDGVHLVIGAYGDDGLRGSAYAFEHDGHQWVQTQKLLSGGRSAYDLYGWSVSLCGDVLVVGEPQTDTWLTGAGLAIVYRYDGSSWVPEQALSSLDHGRYDEFGHDVCVDDGGIAIASYLDDDGGFQSGSASFFRHNGERWVEVWNVIGSDTVTLDFLSAVGLDGTRAMVGATGDDDKGSSSGSVYCYELDHPLALSTSHSQAQPGDLLELKTCGGLGGGLRALFVTEISGTPITQLLGVRVFADSGFTALTGSVPPGLSGIVVEFLSIGFTSAGTLGVSNVVDVVFQ